MRKYRVVFTESAEKDLGCSFEWGREKWGEDASLLWYRDLRKSVRKVLTHFPFSQPLAPEHELREHEMRQMIVGRYRVLFIVDGKTVKILAIRGAFVD